MSNKLDGYQWFKAVRAGASHLINNHVILNKINVFPVADGDTGSNLASLMRSVISNTRVAAPFSVTSKSIALASLVGARGNSGTIFSQFFYGFCSQEREIVDISVEEFCDLVVSAAAKAKKAVGNPLEGTVLSVMEAWAQACAKLKVNANNFAELFNESLAVARAALKNTINQLEVLRQTNLVDAGGQGFVYFLEGVAKYLANPEMKIDIAEQNLSFELTEDEHAILECPEHRYCVEALITDLAIPIDSLKNEIAKLGDSLAIAGDESNCRIHVHTNMPWDFAKIISASADIAQQKIDDMLRQYQAMNQRQSKTALLVDSSVDLPPDFIEAHQIHIVPLQIQMNHNHYFDRLTISTSQIYQELLNNKDSQVSTSMPNQSQVEKMLDFLGAQYQEIIAITLPSQQSGTYQLIKNAGEKLNIDLSVVDSCRNSAAHGFLVQHAVKAIADGKSKEQIVNELNELKKKTNLYVAVENLKYTARSGRVSKNKAHLVSWLGINPVIALDDYGKGYILSKAFGFKGALKKLAVLLKKKPGAIKEYVIVHVEAEQGAQILAEILTRELGQKPSYITTASPVLGIHAGPGSVAVAAMWE